MARGRGKKIDYTHWTLGTFSATALSAGTVAATVFAAQHLSETLLRMRGEWFCGLDGAQSPGPLVSIAVGLILVPEGTGTTVLWSPISDADAPWIWWDVYHLAYEEMVADSIQSASSSGARRVIDNKAMRIIRNQEMQFVAENATIGNASAVNLAGSVRGLFGT